MKRHTLISTTLLSLLVTASFGCTPKQAEPVNSSGVIIASGKAGAQPKRRKITIPPIEFDPSGGPEVKAEDEAEIGRRFPDEANLEMNGRAGHQPLSASASAIGKRVVAWTYDAEQEFDALAFNKDSKAFIQALRDSLDDSDAGISTYNAGYEAPKLGFGVSMKGPYSQTWYLTLEAVIDPFENTAVIQIDACRSTGPDGRPSQRRSAELDNLLRNTLIPKIQAVAESSSYQLDLGE